MSYCDAPTRRIKSMYHNASSKNALVATGDSYLMTRIDDVMKSFNTILLLLALRF